jgi:F-type H+-transporting ATPase subunit b
MPQFDQSTFASQLFWLYVSFALLLLLMSVFALPKIGGVLEARQKRIDDNLDKAAQWKSEAELAIATYEKALRDARQQAQQILKAGAATIAAQAESRQKALGERLAAQIKEGEARILAARDQAMTDIRGLSVELAQVTLRKLTGQTAQPGQVEAAVAAALGPH